MVSDTATASGSELSAGRPVLMVAFELGERSWKLAFTRGFGQPVVERHVAARSTEGVLRQIAWAKRRLGLPEVAPVRSCYEAGREGFWLHRFLEARGVENLVVDSASIEVNRKKRRAKSDRIDLAGLLDLLIRHWAGSGKKVWSVVRVPTVEQEDARHLHRELQLLKADRARIASRIRGLLATMGVTVKSIARMDPERLRQWDGSPLPPGLQGRLARYRTDHEGLSGRIQELEQKRRQILREAEGPVVDQVRRLDDLRGIGTQSAWLLVLEFFGWREFRNRREVGSAAGMTPTPHDSGAQRREQGIGKDGSSWVRGLAVELAWAWLRHQPQSALSRWYERRFAHGGARVRKIGIVALARKLLIALWQFLDAGVLPEGAELKPAVRVR